MDTTEMGLSERTRFNISALPASARARIRAARRRLNLAVAAGHACRAAAAALMGAGVFVLTAKLLARELLVKPAGPLAAGALAAVVAYLLLRRGASGDRPFDDRDAAVLYDLTTRGGGLTLAIAEKSSRAWAARVRALPVTPVRLRPAALARPMALPAAFLAGALLVPGRKPPESRADHAFRRAVAGAAETAESLFEAEVLEPEALEMIKQELEQLRSEPSAERSWEALDTMEERMASQVQETADALAWAMAATDALAESPGDGIRRKELEAALARLEKSGALGELPPELAADLARSGEGGGGLPTDPKALRRTLGTLSEHLEKKAAKACSGASGCKGTGTQQALDDLAAYVDERLSTSGKPGQSIYLTQEMEDALYGENGEAGMPGAGGITRGRGDAPIVWGTPTDPQGAEFAPHDLPPGFADPDSAQTLAVVMGAPPEPGEVAHGIPSGVAARDGVGESAGAQRLSPARREVVRRYFGATTVEARGRPEGSPEGE
jgi:hypothetical protein